MGPVCQAGKQATPEAQRGLRGRSLGQPVDRKPFQAGMSRCPLETVGLVASRLQLVVEIPEGCMSSILMPKGWKVTSLESDQDWTVTRF